MTKLNLPDTFIVFDLEWTAWNGSQKRNWSNPNEWREIFDIGAVKVSKGTLYENVATYSQLITLELSSQLPSYSTGLTSITQGDIDATGVSFEQALADFSDFCEELHIYAWGNDGNVLAENCWLKEVTNPFRPRRFHNMRQIFKNQGVPIEKYHSSTIVEYFGQTNKHVAHRGLDDALNIAEAVRLLDK